MDPRYKSPTANVELDLDEEFRDIEQFTNVLRWMLLIGALFAFVSLISGIMFHAMLSFGPSMEEARSTGVRETALRALTLLYAIATLMVFARWIVLAHRNLPALGARYLDVTPAGAVAWFFVPVVQVWFPYRAMRTLWQNSHSARRPDLQDVSWVLPAWWTLWLAFIYMPFIEFLLLAESRSIDEAITAVRFIIAGRIASIALHIVASVLVVRIWNAQRKQHENPGEYDPAPGFADGAI